MTVINIHLNKPNPIKDPTGTTIPNGSVAALLAVEKKLGIKDRVGIDTAIIPHKDIYIEKIKDIIAADQLVEKRTSILFSVLTYNAEETLTLIEELKREYGDQITTVVGGQLVPYAKDAYLENENIDIVAVGDGEVLIPKIFEDLEKGSVKNFYEGWVENGEFSTLDYDEYFGLEEMIAREREGGKYVYLTVQLSGGPGCSWAAENPNGACKFCALQNITTMNKTPLRQLLEAVADLKEKYDIDGVFDVANQFLPSLNRSTAKTWLTQFEQYTKELGLEDLNFSIYLATGSIDEEMADMLEKIGVEHCFIGIDHFDSTARAEQNKQASRNKLEPKRTLDFLSQRGITFEIGVVVGSTSSEKDGEFSVIDVGIKDLIDQYPENLIGVGLYQIGITPGSKVWDEFKQLLEEHSDVDGWQEAMEAMESFKTHGYFTREQDMHMSSFYMRLQGHDPYKVYHFIDEIRKKYELRIPIDTTEVLDLFGEPAREMWMKIR